MTQRFSCDDEHRISLVEIDGDAEYTGAEYRYDALGRRTEKQVWRRHATQYAWSGLQMVGETSDSHPDAAVQYIHVENSYEPLARVDSYGEHTETFWYHTAKNRRINMKKINDSYISMLWQALSEDPNMDDSLVGLNLSNEKSLSLALRELIKPSYDNFPYFIKGRCKNSLAYAINFYDGKML